MSLVLQLVPTCSWMPVGYSFILWIFIEGLLFANTCSKNEVYVIRARNVTPWNLCHSGEKKATNKQVNIPSVKCWQIIGRQIHGDKVGEHALFYGGRPRWYKTMYFLSAFILHRNALDRLERKTAELRKRKLNLRGLLEELTKIKSTAKR